ncbi:MAG: FG-GAP and VCBS repeat-containing protein, partial [Myxococcota bacterium]
MRWIGIVAVGGCGGLDPNETGDGYVPPDPTTSWSSPTDDPCATPLALSPEAPGVLPLGGTRFVATGGSGDVTFALVDDRSGGVISSSGGFYVAGPVAGVVDTVEVTDATCAATARASVTVYGPMSVSPTAGEVLPGSSFELVVTGGSGAHRCEVGLLASGGALVGCVYTAGDSGIDRLVVIDAETVESVDVALTVTPDASLSAPADQLLIPLGDPVRPAFVGGTGHVVATVEGGTGGVDVVDSWFTGTAEGTVSLRIDDQFTALSTAVTVVVAAPRGAVAPRDGERTYWGHVVPLGDVTGDGYDDAALAIPEASVTAHQSGGVYVYAGGPDGLEPDPVQVLSWPTELATFGRGATAGDFDGDGRLDLAVGADGAGLASTTSGLVLVYEQSSAGGFDPEPVTVIEGEHGGDRNGYALAACDIDGDGVDDLVSAALSGEDYTQSTIQYSQGAVYVYRGGGAGVDPARAFAAFGRNPSGAAFVDVGGLSAGRQLAVGDWTGDGRCDVAVSSLAANLQGSAVGAVYLYDGATLASGVVPVDPLRVWSPDPARDPDKSANFGYAIDLGDVDGDGRADLAVGAYSWDGGGFVSGGAAFVFRAAGDPDAPATTIRSDLDAQWIAVADEGYDYLGVSLDLADTTGDGVPDLIVGALGGEVAPPPGTSPGSVAVYDGATLGSASAGTVATPSSAIAADEGGAVVGAAGDPDGDGAIDLVVHASRSPVYGVEVGQPRFVPGDAVLPVVALGFPGVAAGTHFGDPDAAALFDVDGDGAQDLVVGGWGVGDPALANNSGYNAGQVYTVAWDGAAFADPAAAVGWAAVPSRSANDQLGVGVVPVGDVDGDGWDDLA